MPSGDNFRKLTEDETIYIRKQIAKGRCQSALARRFGVSRQRVNQIKRDGLSFISAVKAFN